MSPPEVWGPAVWTLFHTLAEKVREDVYPIVLPNLFNIIVRICKFLPCPECSNDASNFLAKVKISDMKNKTQFKNQFYLFHNWVNAKKRKPLFNYNNLSNYSRYNLINVVNNFVSRYQTKGNMKLLTESFQRQFIIKDFKSFITGSIKAFIPPINVPKPLPQANNTIIDETIQKEINEIENGINEQPVVAETEEHVVAETEEHVVAETEQHDVAETEQHDVAETEEHVVAETEEHVVAETEEHVVVETEEHVVAETEVSQNNDTFGLNMNDIYKEPNIDDVIQPMNIN
jgi:hypothetical protein